jgi:hypothetical protein
METAARQLNVPAEVIKILASHGAVRVSVPGFEGAGQAAIAPFEDVLHLFVSPSSPLIAALLKSTRLEVAAKGDEGTYQVRMTGRSHAGRRMAGHPMSSVLEPWAPEDVPSHRWVVVPFVPEEIEFVRGDGEEVRRNAGLTRAGQERPPWSRIWLSVTYSGMAGVLALLFIVACTTWFGLQGADYVGRPIGLTLGLMSGLCLIGGTRLFVVAQGFIQWRLNRAARADAPWLSEGYLAPYEARLGGATLLAVAAIGLGSLWMIWGTEMVARIVIGSGIWLCLPAWALHLAMGRPEPRR